MSTTNRILLAKGPNGSNLDQLFAVKNNAAGKHNLVLKNTYDLSANLRISRSKNAGTDDASIVDTNSNELLVFGETASAVNEIKISNAATGAGPTITAQGGDTDVDLNLVAKGTGVVSMTTNADRKLKFDFDGTTAAKTTTLAVSSSDNRTITLPDLTTTLVGTNTTDTLLNKTLTEPKIVDGGFIADANGNESIVFGTTAAAVNEFKIINAATGAGPTITAQGDDANVDLNLVAKGTGAISMKTNTNRFLKFDFDGTAAATTTTLAVNSTADRTITLPNSTDTLVGLITADTLLNKTLTAPNVNTSIVMKEATNDLTIEAADQATGAGTVTFPDLGAANGNVVIDNLAQTLTNKTLTAPTINGNTTLSGNTIIGAGAAGVHTLNGYMKGVTNTLVKTVAFTGGSSVIASGAMAIPANSLITNLAVIAKDALTFGSGSLGVKVGTAANGAQICTGVVDNILPAANTTLAVGKGTAVDAKMQVALGGNAALTIVVGEIFRATATDIHFTVTAGGSAMTAGEAIFLVEYMVIA
jgi:hypothetical protein